MCRGKMRDPLWRRPIVRTFILFVPLPFRDPNKLRGTPFVKIVNHGKLTLCSTAMKIKLYIFLDISRIALRPTTSTWKEYEPGNLNIL